MKAPTTTQITIMLLCLLCLSPAAARSATPSSFAATGLLAHQHETAGEVLLRAHQRDAKAILLVVVGYTRGLGGFPREPLLANSWIHQLINIGAMEAVGLASLLLAQESDPPQIPSLGHQLAWCELARQDTRLISAFRESGIFDLERACEELLVTKGANPGWEETYSRARRMAQEKGRVLPVARVVRELCRRPSSPMDEQLIDQLSDISLALFFAATTHDPANERPDWSNERLIAFLDAQYNTAMLSRISLVTREIATFLQGRFSEDPAHVLADIYKAHLGDMKAVRTMARYYQEGNFGFIKNTWLANGWLAYGAYRGDSRCQLQLAAMGIVLGLPEYGQPWADIAGSDASEKDLRDEARKLADILKGWLDEPKRGWATKMQAQIRTDMKKRAEWEIRKDNQPDAVP